jgi:hypothetical protein
VTVFQDDQNLTWPDEAELLARDGLERDRIFLKATDVVAEGGILAFEMLEILRRDAKLLSDLDRPREAAVAEQAIEQQYATEREDRPANPASLTAPSGHGWRFGKRCRGRHSTRTYQRPIKSTSGKLRAEMLNADC